MPAPFAAVVLAGDRRPDDPLALDSGLGSKALVTIAGQPMVLRVLDALRDARSVDGVVLSGPLPDSLGRCAPVAGRVGSGAVRWQPPGASPSTSAGEALAGIAPDRPVLLTTADHPLLRAEWIDHFCAAARASGADAVVGLAPYGLVREIFPTMRKTLLRFRDGDYCGCNLFAFLTPRARELTQTWRAVESARKTPWRVIGLLGWGAVLRYRLGLLSLDAAMELLSRRTGLRLAAVRMPFGEAAVDVDSREDFALVEARLREREPAT